MRTVPHNSRGEANDRASFVLASNYNCNHSGRALEECIKFNVHTNFSNDF